MAGDPLTDGPRPSTEPTATPPPAITAPARAPEPRKRDEARPDGELWTLGVLPLRASPAGARDSLTACAGIAVEMMITARNAATHKPRIVVAIPFICRSCMMAAVGAIYAIAGLAAADAAGRSEFPG